MRIDWRHMKFRITRILHCSKLQAFVNRYENTGNYANYMNHRKRKFWLCIALIQDHRTFSSILLFIGGFWDEKKSHAIRAKQSMKIFGEIPSK